MRLGFPGSVRLRAREFDHLGPLLGFLGDELAEIGRRAGHHRAAQVSKPRLDLGIGETGVDLSLSLSTMSAGVPLGVPTPYQTVAS